MVGDLLGVADAFGVRRFHLVGDDLGAVAAWNTALLRPDRIRSVTGISIPFIARGNAPADQILHLLDTSMSTETPYLLRLMEEGIDREMAADPKVWIAGCLASVSGLVGESERLSGMVPKDGRICDSFIPNLAPTFVGDDLLADLAGAYSKTGFAGSMHWYRRIARDWPLLAPWRDRVIEPPAMFIGGELDPIRLIVDGPIADLQHTAPQLARSVRLAGVGHWPHLERPDEVLDLLIDFMTGVEAASG